MATKATLGLLAFALIFIMFAAARQAWGEPDCYAEKSWFCRNAGSPSKFLETMSAQILLVVSPWTMLTWLASATSSLLKRRRQ
jgi:hypothetical protein